MDETTTVVSQSEACDSLAVWLGQELKALNARESEVLRTKKGEEQERLLAAVADEFAEIREALKNLQERREWLLREKL